MFEENWTSASPFWSFGQYMKTICVLPGENWPANCVGKGLMRKCVYETFCSIAKKCQIQKKILILNLVTGFSLLEFTLNVFMWLSDFII